MIVDGHTDLLYELAFRAGDERPFATHWLPKLRAGGVGVQVCPIYVDISELPELGLRRALEQAAAFRRAVDECPDDVYEILTAADLDRLDSRVGLLLSLEGAEPFGYDPGLAEVFFGLGARMFSLTWNRRNPFADGVGETSDGGLSGLGRTLVDRLAGLGAIHVVPDALLPAGMALDAAVEGLAGPEDYPALVTALRGRGYDGERLDAVLGGNWLRLLQKALP